MTKQEVIDILLKSGWARKEDQVNGYRKRIDGKIWCARIGSRDDQSFNAYIYMLNEDGEKFTTKDSLINKLKGIEPNIPAAPADPLPPPHTDSPSGI
jgi:hypothetical protein